MPGSRCVRLSVLAEQTGCAQPVACEHAANRCSTSTRYADQRAAPNRGVAHTTTASGNTSYAHATTASGNTGSAHTTATSGNTSSAHTATTSGNTSSADHSALADLSATHTCRDKHRDSGAVSTSHRALNKWWYSRSDHFWGRRDQRQPAG